MIQNFKNIIIMKTLIFSLILSLIIGIFHVNGQQIWHTHVPEWGGNQQILHGRVDVNPQNYRVASYIFVEEAGGWWTKPTLNYPTIGINSDSTFTLGFNTGGIDYACTRLITFLVPVGYNPPLAHPLAELPASLFNFPYAISARPHGNRTIHWSSMDWIVKRSVNNLAIGPGPNVFSSEPSLVFVDNDGHLHLSIKYQNGKWLCTEIIADTTLGYGVYTFRILSRVDDFDIMNVLGLFTWDDIAKYSLTAPTQYFRELDIEFSYWGDQYNDVGQYVIQPWTNPQNIYRFGMDSATNTIHQIDWRKDTVIFRSLTADTTLLENWMVIGANVPQPELENIRLNFWISSGTPQQDQEVALSGFHFKHHLGAPENLQASVTDTLKISLSWNEMPGYFYGIYRSLFNDPIKAQLLTESWLLSNSYIDFEVEAETNYHYWVRAADNINGSNATGYASGFSKPAIGMAIDYNTTSKFHSESKEIQITPNPNKGLFTVSGNFEEVTISIYDLNGVKIHCEKTPGSNFLLDIDLKSGVYILGVKTECNFQHVTKLLIIK
jgi:hypothetical protein